MPELGDREVTEFTNFDRAGGESFALRAEVRDAKNRVLVKGTEIKLLSDAPIYTVTTISAQPVPTIIMTRDSSGVHPEMPAQITISDGHLF